MTNAAIATTRTRPTPRESGTTQPAPSSIELPDGSKAELKDGALEVLDPAGRLLIRYREGHAEIVAAHGDLRLAAPTGRVVITSALDVAIEAGRDLVQRASRSVEIGVAGPNAGSVVRMDPTSIDARAERIELEARTGRATLGEATLVARAITSSAERIATFATHYERVAERTIERAKDAFREVAGLAEERAGRLRTLVRGAYTLASESTDLTSTDDTSIDGKRILLG